MPQVSRSRRTFLKSLPTVVAASAAANAASVPASAAAFQSTPAPDEVTTDALGVAQQLIGVELPHGERDSARPLVSRNRENYEALRKVTVPAETEPAFSFRPRRPHTPRRRGARRRSAAPATGRTAPDGPPLVD